MPTVRHNVIKNPAGISLRGGGINQFKSKDKNCYTLFGDLVSLFMLPQKGAFFI